MKRNNRTAASGLTLAQTRAIGRMTINSNWLEHGIEVLVLMIVSDSPEKLRLIEQALKPLGFRQKLQVLRGLVAELPNHYVKSAELDRAYAEFAAAVKSLSSTAERLNEFRNNVVHWRPFLVIHDWKKQPKFTAATAAEIDAQSIDMDKMGTQFFARALHLYSGDGTLTFGTHVKRGPSSPKKQQSHSVRRVEYARISRVDQYPDVICSAIASRERSSPIRNSTYIASALAEPLLLTLRFRHRR
jgi:hypothetical protein